MITPADKVAYEQLISSMADQVPHMVCGKPNLEQLSQLESADVALVCRGFPVDVMDALPEEFELEAIGADIGAQDFARLGARVAAMVERACRQAIAYDVMCELEERERQEQIERDLYDSTRGRVTHA